MEGKHTTFLDDLVKVHEDNLKELFKKELSCECNCQYKKLSKQLISDERSFLSLYLKNKDNTQVNNKVYLDCLLKKLNHTIFLIENYESNNTIINQIKVEILKKTIKSKLPKIELLISENNVCLSSSGSR